MYPFFGLGMDNSLVMAKFFPFSGLNSTNGPAAGTAAPRITINRSLGIDYGDSSSEDDEEDGTEETKPTSSGIKSEFGF